jgi:outer membrane protein assembly factor BamA
MGFSSVDEAKQAYVDQCAQAESQHVLVKQLIQEINQVSNRVPTREEVMSRLNELSAAPVKIPEAAVSVETPVTSVPENAVDVIQENIVPPVSNVSTEMSSDSSTDLGNMLFASL